MKGLFNVERFIEKKVTGRDQSLLAQDFAQNRNRLNEKIRGRSVLVVGGAGTIGSSYIKALLPFKPAKLVVADINENGLTELVRDCRSRSDLQLPSDFKPYPVNFGDRVFEKIFRKEGPFQIVANFAAHKHVRSEKDVFSIEAMIENNVIRAKRFLDQLLASPPEHFFCVSTDKAANPVNIMGASKKLMEEVILAYADQIKISTARFANVAFSNGSLLAGFIERLMKQQPLSCPADVRRYFVSPAESGEICLMACMLGNSGEILFPKLQPEKDLVLFKTIAIDFLKEIGYEADECSSEEEAKFKAENVTGNKYPVYFFTSDTSGEKLYEEFYTEEETIELNRFHSLGVVTNAARRSKAELDKVIAVLENLFKTETKKESVVKMLNELLPTFQHVETGLNLDQKM
jgi:FlaA1/EpsC-like NDP-sugar epimerase